MEDQVAQMQARGIAVERIHSGRDRATSRQVCLDYLNGKLQFLFVAPERLRVPGFPEMLAKRKPCLIAVDEAHCISQWGHDFRPDYRTFGQHLPSLRPAPVIALTATATPQVQDDIARQLGLATEGRFIQASAERISPSKWCRRLRANVCAWCASCFPRKRGAPRSSMPPRAAKPTTWLRSCSHTFLVTPTTRAWARKRASVCKPAFLMAAWT